MKITSVSTAGQFDTERVNHGWKEPAQIVMAEVMYWFVRQFGEPIWDKHDSEFRA